MFHVPQQSTTKVKTGKKRRGSLKKKSSDDDWLKELHAAHTAVQGSCFGAVETEEDKAFFADAKRTEKEAELLAKEFLVEDTALPDLPGPPSSR